MGRIIVANRRGHQVVEWSTTDSEEARATVAEAERILREARAAGCGPKGWSGQFCWATPLVARSWSISWLATPIASSG